MAGDSGTSTSAQAAPQSPPPASAVSPNPPAAPAQTASGAAQTASPAAQPASPAAQPASSAAQPASPAAQPASPAAQPASPAAQPASPAAQPASPAAQPSSPAAQPISDAEAHAAAGILPASFWEPIENEITNDNDSAFSDVVSSTASMSSSILRYRTLHGRTYHSDIGKAESWEPNDDHHSQAMDMNHHLNEVIIGGKLFLAPIDKNVQKVLDIGTGTGIWAIDFGDMYPGAEVIGTDVSPIQPPWVPPNVKFEIDDANLEWTWDDNTFDFVHVRTMAGSIVDWPSLYREAFRCCKPGGWIESNEPAFPFGSEKGIREDSAMGQWGKVYHEGGQKFGRTFRVVEDDIQRKCMEEAGFVDIVVKDFKCPFGDWPRDIKQKELGILARLVLTHDLEGYVLYMWSAVMGWTPDEVKVYVAHLKNELYDRSVESYFTRRVVYARKPLTA